MLAAAIVFALVFSAELYLFAATASIYESYQPDISAALRPFNPLLLLLAFGGGPLLLALALRRHRARLARFARTTSVVACAICVLVFLGVFLADSLGIACDRPPPVVRELGATLQHALTCPQPSGRSGAAAFYGGILSGIFAWGAGRILRVDLSRPLP